MSEEQHESALLLMNALDGDLYVEVFGRPAELKNFNEHRQGIREGLCQSDLFQELSFIAEQTGVQLINHRTTAKSQSRNLVEMIRAIQHSRTADKAFIRLQALFEIAGETEINELLRSPKLAEMRDYIGSVLEDLDERSDEARQQLKDTLPPTAAYLLVPDPL